MFDIEKRPKVGVGIIILKDGKFLLGHRKKKDGGFHWSIPGGKIEYGESFRDTAIREVVEETGLEVEILDNKPLVVTNDIYSEGHYVTLFLRARYISKEPELKEPQTFKEWRWLSIDDLPDTLSSTVKNLVNSGVDFLKS